MNTTEHAETPAGLPLSRSLFAPETGEELVDFDVTLTPDAETPISMLQPPIIRDSDQDCACE